MIVKKTSIKIVIVIMCKEKYLFLAESLIVKYIHMWCLIKYAYRKKTYLRSQKSRKKEVYLERLKQLKEL